MLKLKPTLSNLQDIYIYIYIYFFFFLIGRQYVESMQGTDRMFIWSRCTITFLFQQLFFIWFVSFIKLNLCK